MKNFIEFRKPFPPCFLFYRFLWPCRQTEDGGRWRKGMGRLEPLVLYICRKIYLAEKNYIPINCLGKKVVVTSAFYNLFPHPSFSPNHIVLVSYGCTGWSNLPYKHCTQNLPEILSITTLYIMTTEC